MKIYSLGSLNIDYVYRVSHFVRPGETVSSVAMEKFPGGKGLNQSVALAKAGAQVRCGGMVGQDGKFLLDTLTGYGADVERVATCEGASGHAIIQVDDKGQNCILLYPGANHQVTQTYVEGFLQDAAPGDLLLLQNEISCLPEIFAIAAQKQLHIALNPSPFDSALLQLPLEQVKWWFCNEIEAAALFGGGAPEEMAQHFLAQYPGSNLVLTLGGEGCLFCNAKLQLRLPACKVQPVDTTAAGDTFTGFFLAAIAAGKSEEDALCLATKAAAITVTRMGASVSIPYANEVQ